MPLVPLQKWERPLEEACYASPAAAESALSASQRAQFLQLVSHGIQLLSLVSQGIQLYHSDVNLYHMEQRFRHLYYK